MEHPSNTPLFPAGDLLLSPEVLNGRFDHFHFLFLHLGGDWGDIPLEEAHENEEALKQGGEILSRYRTSDSNGVKATLVIMTAADRTYTVIFLLGESLSLLGLN